MMRIKRQLLPVIAAVYVAVAVKTPVVAAEAADYTNVNAQTGYACVLEDRAQFLTTGTAEEYDTLIQWMDDITRYCNIVVATTTDHDYYSTRAYAEATYEGYFGHGSNGAIFVIDRDQNEIYIVSEGDVQSLLSDSRCEVITDNTYIYATESHDYDYMTCTQKSLEQIYASLNGQHIASPMKMICNILLALGMAMILNYFLARVLSRPHMPNHKKVLNGLHHRFVLEHPKMVMKGKSKRRSSSGSSSSGGGGGSFGGGGGGGSSGGGHSI